MLFREEGLCSIEQTEQMRGGETTMNSASYHHPIHTTNSSTLHHLYLINQNRVFCIDAGRGETIWHAPVPGQRLWDTRIKACCCQLQVLNQVISVLLDFDVYALDARTGQQIWHASNPERCTSLAFAVDQHFLYQAMLNLDSFQAEPGPATTDDTSLRALRISDGSLVWHTTAFHPQRDTGFLLRKATIYALVCKSKGLSQRGRADGEWQLFALDTLGGALRWSVSLGGFATLRAEEGRVYAFVDRQGVVVLDEHTGQEIWHWSGWGGVEEIALIEDILFINWNGIGSRRDRSVFALDHRTGQQIWMRQHCELAALTSDGLFPALRHQTTRLDLRTGEPLWEPPVPHPHIFQSGILWSAIIAGHWCFLEYQYRRQDETTRYLFVLKEMDVDTGKLVSERIISLPPQRDMHFFQQNNGLLFFSGQTPTMYTLSTLSLATGELAWSLDIPIPSEPRAPRVHSVAVSVPVLAP